MVLDAPSKERRSGWPRGEKRNLHKMFKHLGGERGAGYGEARQKRLDTTCPWKK